MKTLQLRCLLAATLCDVVCTATGQVIFETRALTGEVAPGTTAGEVFTQFTTAPVFNASGQIAFPAYLSGVTFQNTGIWSEESGSLALVARASYPAPIPGDPFASFDGFGFPRISDGGHVAFRGIVFTDSGIFSGASGALGLVAYHGDPAPGTDGQFLNLLDPSLNAAGQTAFGATLSGSGIGSTNDSGIWSEGSGALALVAREGDPAPGTDGGVMFFLIHCFTRI